MGQIVIAMEAAGVFYEAQRVAEEVLADLGLPSDAALDYTASHAGGAFGYPGPFVDYNDRRRKSGLKKTYWRASELAKELHALTRYASTAEVQEDPNCKALVTQAVTSRVEMLRQLRRDIPRLHKGGEGKKGRRLPHNEVIRRALVYDKSTTGRGESWLNNAPRNRTLPDVLTLLDDKDTCDELIAGGDAGPRLSLVRVEVDREAERVDMTEANGKERFISFRTLAETIAKLKRKSS